MDKTGYKSGYIAVIGKPNAGKSTIINNLIGQKLSVVTARPQTTRNNILGILTTEQYQMIFVDTPGIHKPRTLLGKYMVKQARISLHDSDMALFIIESYGITQEDGLVGSLFKGYEKPVFLIINKIDCVHKNDILPIINEIQNVLKFQEILPVSALKGENMDLLKEKIINLLPDGPQYYAENQLSDKQERFFVSEIVREQALRYLQEEVPHSVAVLIEDMKDRSAALSYIKAAIYVERESQKQIVIGKNGKMIKEIGKESRKRIEKFLGRKVYIELWVKVSKDWRKNPAVLKTLGYS